MANNALNQKLKPSAKLAEVIGTSGQTTRAEAVKRLWDYVKEHDLQNPENRREILADDKLKQVFGKAKISMFEVGRVVNENLSGEAQTSTHKKKVA
ncbi:MAG: SWIB/MDM2 domain-containing protein [Acidobacteriaceae bacterium]|nr:SWIB/MDM2 domain-containing protein [Acidobacteriaceae bacterium]